ncbi:MAG: cupredoxin domain-containing protein [Candidatus Tectomicrobia bacterium]|nr:cupredoxin domain-containing protein [Candidatus Tectomicrobia bacterium]
MERKRYLTLLIGGLILGFTLPFIMAQVREKSPAEEIYVGPFTQDTYYMFSSSGQSGGVFVIGLPSGRLFMDLPVFEPRAAYGYASVGSREREMLEKTGGLWGDTHHPRLSHTNWDADGRWLYINDKASTRVAKIDLRVFRTVLIKNVPNTQTVHGISLVDDEKGSTKYLCANMEFETPLSSKAGVAGGYSEKAVPAVGAKVPEDWVSGVTCLDAETLDPVFQVLSNYGNFDIQDSTPDGKWVLSTIYNMERGSNIDEMIKGAEDAVQFIHIPTAEKALKDGKFTLVNGVKTLDRKGIPGLVTILPAARSPHGIHCQRLPDKPGVNTYCIAAGKLAPVVNIYDVSGPQPKLVARPEVCLGPLHVQYDGRGNAYVSCFIDSQITAFNIENAVKFPTEPKKYIIDKIDIHYNVGHLSTVKNYSLPVGDWLVSQNKLTKGLPGFLPTGPLEPEVQELIDIRGISKEGKGKMRLLYQFPTPPEPHESDFVEAKKLAPIVQSKYKKPFDPAETPVEESKVVRTGPNSVRIYLTTVRSRYGLDEVRVKQGDEVTLTLTNVERLRDITHGFALQEYGVHSALDPGDTKTFKFVADKPGVYWFYCTWFCSALHMEMRGRLIVEPKV